MPNNAVTHVLFALAPVPGRRQWAARLGYAPSRWSFVAFPLAALTVFLVWSGWLYPLRPDTFGALGHPLRHDPALAGAWGGPTLAGAWLVHALLALGTQVLCLAAIRRLHGRRAADVVR